MSGLHATDRVARLLARMTVEEKVGQMTQLTIGAVTAADSPRRGDIRLDPDRLRGAIAERHVGSLINILGGSLTMDGWRQLLQQIQSTAAEARLGIPVLYGIDHVHGANYLIGGTILPHNIALAATFDPDLAARAAGLTAFETRSAGLPWNFAPVLDVGRQPLWPRFYETFGESEWLTAEMGAAVVRGFQDAGVAATGKHYLAYSGPTHGRDRTPALLGRRTIHEQFLPPFRRAVQAGVAAVMINSGEIDGEPVHASRYWLTDVLRGQLGFDGVVVTDWADITFLHTRHRVAPTLEEATRLAIDAGIDLAMTPDNFDFTDSLLDLIRDGRIPESRIDRSVRRILTLKEELGLFETAVPDGPEGAAAGAPPPALYPRATPAPPGAPASDFALEAARAVMTLLKNDGSLPLSPTSRVLVTGPAAASLSALNGGWTHTWQGLEPEGFQPDATTLLDEIRSRAAECEHLEGARFDQEVDVAAAADAAARADIAIVALGEDAYAEWAGDIRDLSLPPAQLRLAREIMATGTPTVLVLVQGRPRLIREIADDAAAILLAYWPGTVGGRAIAGTLFGEVNPSGRLPFTYPRYANDLAPHDHKFTETMDTRLEPRGPGGFDPQFELGAGLGYTTFTYSDLRVERETVGPRDAVRATLRVRNTGERSGRHTVLLFTRQHYSRWTPHLRRLRGARQVTLEPGEEITVRFDVPTDALVTVDRNGGQVLEPGAYDILVGDLTATFSVGGDA